MTGRHLLLKLRNPLGISALTIGCRCVHDKLIGQPILQIPENRPTELITVEFSPIESDLYRSANEKLQQLRERAKNRKPGDGSEAIPKGELRKWFNYLRYFTSHPALVEPTYINQQALRRLAPETEGTPVPYYFCRACCNALTEPCIGDVSGDLWPPNPLSTHPPLATQSNQYASMSTLNRR